ncbi:MAG: hypothetical protein ACLP1X_29045 [Polyangiaceae bacterium]
MAIQPSNASGLLGDYKFALSVVGTIGALVAFGIGLLQYHRAQQWKRAEFLASQLKELFDKPMVSTALTMLDWASRKIYLHALVDPQDGTPTLVTLAMQSRALIPHTIPDSYCRETDELTSSRDGESMRAYSPEETIIRDCYDTLLDGLDRLGSYLQGELISAKDLRPYLGYWIDDIASPTSNQQYALWCVCLLTYIYAYHYTGVAILFREFGYDISPEGTIFNGFVKNVGSESAQCATMLQEAAVQSI